MPARVARIPNLECEAFYYDMERRGIALLDMEPNAVPEALEQGEADQMWRTVDADVAPGAAQGLPINVLTDTASILDRAELAGETVSPDRWRQVSAYAKEFFPKGGLAFVEVHAAIAHAMAGDGDALKAVISNSAGPAADLVRDFAAAYGAISQQSWAEATGHLTKAMADHARIGGSRAQRDLL